MVSLLRTVAQRGCTVLTTIHQPSSEAFLLFDRVILMHHGRILFQGPISETVPYFERFGFVCPDSYNPADFVIDLVMHREAIESSSHTQKGKPQAKHGKHVKQQRQGYEAVHPGKEGQAQSADALEMVETPASVSSSTGAGAGAGASTGGAELSRPGLGGKEFSHIEAMGLYMEEPGGLDPSEAQTEAEAEAAGVQVESPSILSESASVKFAVHASFFHQTQQLVYREWQQVFR